MAQSNVLGEEWGQIFCFADDYGDKNTDYTDELESPMEKVSWWAVE